jgi:hypothetical protein
MRVGDNFRFGGGSDVGCPTTTPQGLRLSNRYTIFDGDVLAVPRTPLNLLAIENKQKQDEQANNSQMEDTKVNLNHELGS